MQYIAKIWNLSKDEEGPVIKIRQISRYRLNEQSELKWEKHIKMQEFAEIMDGFDLVLIPKLR